MNSKAMTKAVLTGLLFSLLSASVSMAAGAAGAEGNVRMSRIARSEVAAKRPATPPRVETFRTETDSWLCEHVSPLFCSLIPTLPTTPDSPRGSSVSGGGRR